MKDFNSKVFEEYGYKAHNKGFFYEWRELTSSMARDNDMPMCEASEIAYKQLKLQGSD